MGVFTNIDAESLVATGFARRAGGLVEREPDEAGIDCTFKKSQEKCEDIKKNCQEKCESEEHMGKSFISCKIDQASECIRYVGNCYCGELVPSPPEVVPEWI